MTTTPDTTAKAKTMRELRAEQEPVYATTPTLPGFTMLLPAALDTTPVSEFHGAAYRRTQAERLRKTADGMTRTIEAKANPAVAQQRATHRRTKMTKHMKEESRRLLAKQRTLQALAAAWDDGTLPRALATITSRAALEALTHDTHPDTWPYPSSSYANEYRNKLTRLGIINQDYLASVNGLLRHYRRTTDDVITPEEAAAERLWALQREVAAMKIPGYFNTPPAVCARMLELAHLDSFDPERDTILEPSAGAGHLAAAIRAALPTAEIACVERNGRLREILQLQGFAVVADDCLDFHGTHYARVLMNPPFEETQPTDHLYASYNRLRPGGWLVSVVPEGLFHNVARQAQIFRAWLTDHGAHQEKLPDGSFLKSDRPTGVAARLIAIQRDRGRFASERGSAGRV